MIIAAHNQLRLARPLAEDLRRPWERRSEPRRLTPARVRRGFRNVRATAARPASAPNRPDQVPDGLSARRTSNGPGATTSARPSNAPNRLSNTKPIEVKRQDERLLCFRT
ncbi:hypothetical protein GCM10011583_73540 [Streptomyces camponoticapitis]|uniref:Transposase n=1 Tax=Streptomyces camponoticapitis TaxID=1616125 RepID=A0ABQ2F0W2_9ACTN|nr:hypothetical protein GCM10011583_73540 [Streptomyces camponoticapitis]